MPLPKKIIDPNTQTITMKPKDKAAATLRKHLIYQAARLKNGEATHAIKPVISIGSDQFRPKEDVCQSDAGWLRIFAVKNVIGTRARPLPYIIHGSRRPRYGIVDPGWGGGSLTTSGIRW
jgi:hypothetical protein